MGRKVDDKKTRKALRAVERALELAKARGEDLSAWEQEFAASVKTRLETYGSAFTDPTKGASEEALSHRQAAKVRELRKKAEGKRTSSGLGRRAPVERAKAGEDESPSPRAKTPQGGFGTRTPPRRAARVRQLDEDWALSEPPTAVSEPAPEPPAARPARPRVLKSAPTPLDARAAAPCPSPQRTSRTPSPQRPRLTVIEGGKATDDD